MTPTLILGSAIGGLVLIAGAYAGGRIDGRTIALAAEAKAERAAEAERVTVQAGIDGDARADAARETVRQSNIREIRSASIKIVDRPVYRDICIDDGGVQLLERAAAVANGPGDAEPAGAAGGAAVSAVEPVG